MSKNRTIANIVSGTLTSGQVLIANSDNTYSFSEPTTSATDFSTLDDYTVSTTSDPATDTNPSAAGAIWLNTSTNKLFICTDATTDANVWKGVEAGVIIEEDPEVPPFQGSNYGFTSGGRTPSYTNTIDRFPFAASSANATNFGDLYQTRGYVAGNSSSEYGYTCGGFAPPQQNTIDRFPFAASSANATDFGNLSTVKYRATGQSATDYGYTSGGYKSPPATFLNVIDRFPFAATSANATDFGNLTYARYDPAGQTSSEYGYTSGGRIPQYVNVIDRFPFAATFANATDVGDLTAAGRSGSAGQSSAEYGYASGGYNPNYSTIINKFPFAASSANAVTSGALSQARNNVTGQSSTDYGYSSGGFAPPATNRIDRFPFASDTNATDFGNLSQARYGSAGQQF